MITEMEAADQKSDENEAIPEVVPEVPEETQQAEDAAESDSGAVMDAQDEVVTSSTHTMKSGTYRVTESVTIDPDGTGNGIQVDKGAKVLLYIEEGADAQVVPGRGVILTHTDFEPVEAAEFFGPQSFHNGDYAFFYNNIKDNVAKRVAAYLANR